MNTKPHYPAHILRVFAYGLWVFYTHTYNIDLLVNGRLILLYKLQTLLTLELYASVDYKSPKKSVVTPRRWNSKASGIKPFKRKPTC